VLMLLNLIRKSFFGVAKYIEVYEDVQLIISLLTLATFPVIPCTLLLGGGVGISICLILLWFLLQK
jgi:hypothetical protein